MHAYITIRSDVDSVLPGYIRALPTGERDKLREQTITLPFSFTSQATLESGLFSDKRMKLSWWSPNENLHSTRPTSICTVEEGVIHSHLLNVQKIQLTYNDHTNQSSAFMSFVSSRRCSGLVDCCTRSFRLCASLSSEENCR